MVNSNCMSISYFRKCFYLRIVSLLEGLRKHLSTDARRRSVRRTINKTLSLRERNGYKRHYCRSPKKWSMHRRPVETVNEAEGWPLPLNHKVKKNTFLHFRLSPNLSHNRWCPNGLSPKCPHPQLTLQIVVQIGRYTTVIVLYWCCCWPYMKTRRLVQGKHLRSR